MDLGENSDSHTFNVDDRFHLEMIVNINVIIRDVGLAI